VALPSLPTSLLSPSIYCNPWRLTQGIPLDIRAVSKKTVETLQAYYPETLSRKFFVNVPVIMGWAFAAMKLLASKETVRKFTVLSYAEYLAGELGPGVPKEYGGDADELEVIGEALALTANEGK